MIINRQLKSIPFDKLYETYETAGSAAVEGKRQELDLYWEAEVAKLEQRYTDTHEAPPEVGFADQVPKPEYDYASLRRSAGQKAIADIWIPRYRLATLLVHVLPQALAYMANKPFRLAEVVTVEGQIDGLKMLKSSLDFNSEWDRGLYLFLMLDARSAYLPSQYKGEGVQFCALVPLILYAFKLHHKLAYSRWDRSTLKSVVNKSLLDAMLYTGKHTRDELLHARELGLVYQSGPKVGESRNPQSSFKLWSTKNGCLQGVPHLAQVMLAQIWCAHPSSRTPYMVLDPHNWDSMPPPLIAENIFAPPSGFGHPTLGAEPGNDMPWED